jgi:3-hydroxyisobutyrate dehydrogenase and related beta-hydroxyacid dehydrogenases
MTAARKPLVAFLGLGRMGAPMTANIAKAGYAVRAWNRTPRTNVPAVAGLTVVSEARDAVANADIVLLMLSDAVAVEALLFSSGLAKHLSKGAIVIDMGTCGPRAARDHAHRLGAREVRYLDAPVSGGVKGAQNASVTILVGGDASTFGAARSVLSAMGTPHHLGEVGAGQTAKLANQLIVAGYVAAVAEGVRFAQQQGLDAGQLIAALEGGFADSPVLRQHGRRMAARDFTPGGTCRLHLKDLRLAAELSGDGFSRLVHANEIMHRFATLVRDGSGDQDHSAYFLTYEQP